MNTAGLIGGMGPESTVDYYKQIVALHREHHADGNYPSLIIHSVDLKHALELIDNDKPGLVRLMVRTFRSLERAGADFGAMLSNTPHIVFDEISKQSPLPLISIVDTARDSALERGLKRLAIFGTRTTMEGDTYSRVFSASGMEIVAPNVDDRIYIHDKYFGELVQGKVIDSTRKRLIEIAQNMAKRAGIEGLILGGTELSLILADDRGAGMPVLDTTKLHAAEIVGRMLER
jgi:aspartate racemase